ncbi:hypothetical protein TI05_11940 [Achromatium sp. WMS3]|nr:hypothetical protein TI05_11940 [Achromatium sp. WMS3]
MKKFIPLVLILGTLFWGFQVHADDMYNVGRNASSRAAESAWMNLGRQCTKADILLKILTNSVNRVTRRIRRDFRGNIAAQEFGAGYIDGLVNVLDDVVALCTAECTKIGNFAGQAAAEIFCAVGDAIGGTPSFVGLRDKPNIVCGEPYKMGCESNFVMESMQMCPNWTSGPNYDHYYPASENGCCAYNDSPH